MKKEITALCVAMAALAVASGCASDCDGSGCGESVSGSETGFSVQSSALFGENGGLPYDSAPAAMTMEKTKTGRVKNYQYGRVVAVGDIDGDGLQDIVSSGGGYFAHSQVVVKYGSKEDPYSYYFNNSPTSDEKDYFGAALAVGKFCPNLVDGDIIVASAPGRSMFRGAFGLIYRDKSNVVQTQRMLTNDGAELEAPGVALAVGDVNGDGKADLVFQSTPMTNGGAAYLEPKVSVVLDMCGINGNYKVADSITAASNTNNLGGAIYIKDLDGKGSPEIIIVDNSYKHPEYPDIAPSGAIYFYKFQNGKLVQSRDMLLGDVNAESEGSKAGAQITAVEFSDIDGDGDLDLIVGEPMFITSGKREGRVRTYTNAGVGKAFDSKVKAWSFAPGHSNYRFGSSLKVADLNYDGVDDLIVGAPGYSNGNENAQSHVFVFMGTKDGSVFSVNKGAAFWSYTNPVAATQFEDFGRSLAAADLDKKGWLDLIVGAPQDSGKESGKKYGRIDVFSETNGFCYTADRCLVDGKCYEPSEVSSDSKCMVCDPKQDNFGFSALVCEDKEDDCHKGSTCDPQMGCVLLNKPDGTACGKNSCSKSNALISKSCHSGICTSNSPVSCGDYVCDASLTSCPTSCKSDSECMNGYKCRDSVCSANGAPVITLAPEFSVVRGRSVKLSATAVDPDGDDMVYSWSAEPADGIKFTNDSTLTPTVAVASAIKGGSEYTITLNVKDKNNQPATASAKTKLVVLGGKIEIVSPADNSVLTTSEITFSGTTNLAGMITLNDSKAGKICEAQAKNNKWSCSKQLTAGAYEIVASWNSDKTEKSDALHLTVKDPVPDNKPPVIDMPSELNGIPGEVLTIDASKSSDPDGDKISFEWLGDFVTMLSSTTDAKVSFTIPSDAVAGTVYTVALRVTDEKGDSAVSSINIIVAPHTYSVVIDHPTDGAVLNDSPLVSGTTDWTQMVAVVDDKDNVLCTAQPQDGIWSCNPGLDFGEWTIRAYLDGSEPGIYSDEVKFTIASVAVNEAPVVVLNESYEGIPGQSLVLDASKSYDPEGSILRVEWSGAFADLLSDKNIAAPTFMVPFGTEAGTMFDFTVTMTDADGLSSTGKTTVKALPGEDQPYHVTIVSPEDGAGVDSKLSISGTATADTNVVVRDDADKELCSATSDDLGAWTCEATLAAGEHTFYAYLMSSDGESLMMSNRVTVTVAEAVLPVPVITYPTSGSVISVRPGVEGTVAASEGIVSVWSVEGGLSALVCEADVGFDGTWKCMAGYNLKYDNAYTFGARYQLSKENTRMGDMSEEVSVRTQPEEVADIKITSPANGSRIPSDHPVIFGGTAEPTTIVDVYISDDNGVSWKVACTASTGESGNWACEDSYLLGGSYIVYADDSRDSKVIESTRVSFEVYDAPDISGDDDHAHNAKGGSCSVAPVSGGAFGWMFLLAGFVGAGVIRRRRLS
ncbi:MAG: FG-GAP repeat protein [Proteobacteria bacterium]|nr:FG-GAP repeat protein [Pseudomonadota bacterium]